ncbi:MAG TPA: hypothetical protein VGG39_23410 [Polyangiaceae bacterium]|jgi:hypothetical protein
MDDEPPPRNYGVPTRVYYLRISGHAPTYVLPDLSDLPTDNAPLFVRHHVVGGSARAMFHSAPDPIPGPQAGPNLPPFQNLLRLSDKAVREYESARVALAATVGLSAIEAAEHQLQAAEHFESSVEALHRAFGWLRRLDGGPRWGLAPGGPQAIDDLRLLRNATAHQHENTPEIGEWTALVPRGDRIEIHRTRPTGISTLLAMTYEQLASMIRYIADVATRLRCSPEDVLTFA